MTERRLVGSHVGGLCLFQVFILSCSSIFCVPSASSSAALSFLTSFGYWNPSFPVSTGVRQKWKIMSEDFSFIKLCHILCSFEIDSLTILPLMFSIFSKYRILFLKWLEQFFCSEKNIAVTYFSPCLLLPGKVCHSHEALCQKKKITQITKVLSLILPIILAQVGILGEVISSAIISYIFCGIGYCHRIINFCCR